MNSPFATVYLALIARLQAELPELNWIDHDFGQLDDYSDGRPPVAFPCVLIDFQNFTFENMGDLAQRAEGDVIFKLAFAQHGQTHGASPEAWRTLALEYYDIEWRLHKALHGWSPGEPFGYLTRTQATKENRPLGVRLRTIPYRLGFEDYSTSPVLDTTAKPPLEVLAEI
jgi:hypothetical protein